MPTATLGCIAASLAVESMGNIPIERNVLELKLQSTLRKINEFSNNWVIVLAAQIL